jgi:Ca2+-binding RTX toxin-like protein
MGLIRLKDWDELAFTFGTAATESFHRLIFDDNTGALLFDGDGSNYDTAAVQIATLSTLSLAFSDIAVI